MNPVIESIKATAEYFFEQIKVNMKKKQGEYAKSSTINDYIIWGVAICAGIAGIAGVATWADGIVAGVFGFVAVILAAFEKVGYGKKAEAAAKAADTLSNYFVKFKDFISIDLAYPDIDLDKVRQKYESLTADLVKDCSGMGIIFEEPAPITIAIPPASTPEPTPSAAASAGGNGFSTILVDKKGLVLDSDGFILVPVGLYTK